MAIRSPSLTMAMGPPCMASGEMWPMEAPREPPEKRPSVIRATWASSPHAGNGRRGGQHFLHSRPSHRSFITDHQHIPFFNFAAHDGLTDRLFRIKHARRTFMPQHFRQNRGLLHHASLGRQIAEKNRQTAFGMVGIVQRMDDVGSSTLTCLNVFGNTGAGYGQTVRRGSGRRRQAP